MQVVEGWKALPTDQRGAAVALGNFDGVHLGHQQVIEDALDAARHLGVTPAVISFEPHPRRYFQPDAEPFRLMDHDQMVRALAALGVERLYRLPFDREMAEMSDEAFARRVLGEGLGARHVAAGFDITFGRGRTGSPEALRAYGEALGFSVSIRQPVLGEGGGKLSSSAVRDALMSGDMEAARAILTRPFAIRGEVIHGDARGRTIGVPTANVALGDYVRPRYGVYATRSTLADGRVIDGVANLGLRPMFETKAPMLEVWLFDFSGDLYGQVIETVLIAHLRDEAMLDGLEALKAQIARDAEAARAVLAAEKSAS